MLPQLNILLRELFCREVYKFFQEDNSIYLPYGMWLPSDSWQIFHTSLKCLYFLNILLLSRVNWRDSCGIYSQVSKGRESLLRTLCLSESSTMEFNYRKAGIKYVRDSFRFDTRSVIWRGDKGELTFCINFWKFMIRISTTKYHRHNYGQ